MKDIIKALNKYIQTEYNVSGQFIDRISYRVDKSFGGIRHYTLELYYINEGKSTPITEETMAVKYTEDTKDKAEYEVKQKFTELLFDLVAHDEFRDLMYGRVNF